VDESARLRERTFTGLKGLQDFLRERSADFEAVFSRKLLGYALGRSVLPTDKLLLERMSKQMQDGDATLAGAVLEVVASSQFQSRRNE
jgi:hypothetical protein